MVPRIKHYVPERNKRPIYEGWRDKPYSGNPPKDCDRAALLDVGMAVIDIDTPTGHRNWRELTDIDTAQRQLTDFADDLMRRVPQLERSLIHATFTGSGKGLHLFVNRRFGIPSEPRKIDHTELYPMRPAKHAFHEGEIFDGIDKVTLYADPYKRHDDFVKFDAEFRRIGRPLKYGRKDFARSMMRMFVKQRRWIDKHSMFDADMRQVMKILTRKRSDADILTYNATRAIRAGNIAELDALYAQSQLTPTIKDRAIAEAYKQASANPTLNMRRMIKEINNAK